MVHLASVLKQAKAINAIQTGKENEKIFTCRQHDQMCRKWYEIYKTSNISKL